MDDKKRPGVGVGVLVIKDGKILLGKRKSKHGVGTWSPPGGHLEFNEEIFACAKRETLEEADIEIENLKQGPFTNDNNMPDEKHYVTIYVIADHKSGEPKAMEPDKCEEWQWFDWNNLPSPLFYPLQNFIAKGFSPFDPLA